MKTGLRPVCCMACPSRVRPALCVILRMRKIILRTNGLMRTATPLAGCLRQPPSVPPVTHAAASIFWWQSGYLSSSPLLCASYCCCSSSLPLHVTAFNYSGRRFPALPEKRLSCFASSRWRVSPLVLRIEALPRLSLIPSGFHPRSRSKASLQVA